MANFNPGGCDVPLLATDISPWALWIQLANPGTFWLGRILQMHSSAESRSRNHAVSFANFDRHELDAGQLPRLCTALFVWRRSWSWTLQHQFPASNASPTMRSREPPFWASFGHFNMRKRWINWINTNKSYIRKCHQKSKYATSSSSCPKRESIFSGWHAKKTPCEFTTRFLLIRLLANSAWLLWRLLACAFKLWLQGYLVDYLDPI